MLDIDNLRNWEHLSRPIKTRKQRLTTQHMFRDVPTPKTIEESKEQMFQVISDAIREMAVIRYLGKPGFDPLGEFECKMRLDIEIEVLEEEPND